MVDNNRLRDKIKLVLNVTMKRQQIFKNYIFIFHKRIFTKEKRKTLQNKMTKYTSNFISMQRNTKYFQKNSKYFYNSCFIHRKGLKEKRLIEL